MPVNLVRGSITKDATLHARVRRDSERKRKIAEAKERVIAAAQKWFSHGLAQKSDSDLWDAVDQLNQIGDSK